LVKVGQKLTTETITTKASSFIGGTSTNDEHHLGVTLTSGGINS